MRGWMAAITLASFTGMGWAAGPGNMVKAVDLNAPGALEELHRVDPARFGDVVSILERAESGTGENFEHTVKAHFRGSAGYLSSVVRPTFPAQRDFSFSLGETTYRGRMTLGFRAALMRARGLMDLAVSRSDATNGVPWP